MSRKRARAPTGPYSYDDDDDYVPTKAVKYSTLDEQPGPAKTEGHTLDSDEEEDADIAGGDDEGCAGSEKAFDVLKDDDIEGQEEQTVAFEGETTITPFNMKEEMEEGHFDGDGFYHFKKDPDLIKDAWIDDIDWIKVKHSEDNKNKYGSDDESSDDDEEAAPAAALSLDIYRQMLDYLRPGDTVTAALKRLGGVKKLTSAQKWKLKKQRAGGGEGGSGETGGEGDMQRMLRLTELANNIVEQGNMDVYGETYEMITVKLKPADVEPVMDMFSDTPAAMETEEEKSSVDVVRWQMRWENKEDAEVHGPFTSSQMVKWQDTGYLDKGAYVRKIADKEASWYHTNRIDFELYI